MAVINTTDVVESSMFLKAKLKKNMVGDNYYIENLQSKIDVEWDYRHNVFDIEEEKSKQNFYTTQKPVYTPIEVVMQHVITEKGVKLADDWKKLVFRDIKHPIFRGKRFRFSLDFEKNPVYTEEEKEREASIWLGVNLDQVSPTSSIVVRRCNSNLMFAGSPTLNHENITEYHCEPCILEDEFKYINAYMNSVVNINQAEIYATMQYNHFTKNVKVNDRFVIGNTDLEDRQNNTVFKVKAVSKFTGDSTFKVGAIKDDIDIPLVVIALDRDVLSEQDDLERRVAMQSALYKVEDTTEPEQSLPNNEKTDDEFGVETETKENYEFVVSNDCDNKILLEETGVFVCKLLCNNEEIDVKEVLCVADLLGTEKDSLYFDLVQTDKNVFSVYNKRPYLNDKLLLTFTCITTKEEVYTKKVTVVLGGYY